MDNPFEEILTRIDQLQNLIMSRPVAEQAPPAEIIDTATLCDRLAISEPTVSKWRAKNKIPFLKVDATIRYNWPKVIEALEKAKSKKA